MTKALDVHQATSAERILSTALDLFAVRGYDATSVREICEAAGITKPTLYHFYKSKDGVLRALVTTGSSSSAASSIADLRRQAHSGRALKVHHTRGIRERAAAAALAVHSRRHLGAAGHDRAVRTARSSTTASSDRWRWPPRRRSSGEFAPGPLDVRMLIVMGAISEAATGYRHFRHAGADARARGSSGRHDCGWLVSER